ncbi:MAG: hypothetical protein MUE46_08035 [Xanthomonadales bacterium]|jgi:hypothetical protein|nr:hypothetical protein [Xanthomonadales bacterium]
MNAGTLRLSARRWSTITAALFCGLAAACSAPLWASCAGPHPRGTALVTWNDPDRAGRAVPVRVDYPALSAGTDAPPLSGCGFPTLAFGHGFTISGEAYGWLRDGLVADGLVLLRPLTESGLSPNHLAFGLDLAYVGRAFRADARFAAVAGPFRALGGHSMGGGAAVLGAASAPTDALILFAPAETNPSAVAAAAQVAAPARVYTGSRDCVTPFASHAGPILAALSGSDVARIDLDGGSHCQFSDGSFTCSIGEANCTATISAASQQAQVLASLKPWLFGFAGTERVYADGFEPTQR